MRELFPTIMLTTVVLLCLAVASVRPPSSGVVLVQFNPFDTQNHHVAAIIGADALLVGTGSWPGSFLVSSSEPGLPERLMHSGAVAVLDPFGATGCGEAIPSKNRWQGGPGSNWDI